MIATSPAPEALSGRASTRPLPRSPTGSRSGVITYEEYHPYGSTSWHAEKSGIEVSRKRYRYTGKEKDEETGLYYHGSRYYAPWLGRWVSADPAGMVDGVNRYRYGRNGPIAFLDLDGKQALGLALALTPTVDEGEEDPTPPPAAPHTPPPATIADYLRLVTLANEPAPMEEPAPGRQAEIGAYHPPEDPIAAGPLGPVGTVIQAGRIARAAEEGNPAVAAMPNVVREASEVVEAPLIAGAISAKTGSRVEPSTPRRPGPATIVAQPGRHTLPPAPEAAKGAVRGTSGLIGGVTVKSGGEVIGRGTVDVRGAVKGIQSGMVEPRDVFRNREGLLPTKPPGYYQEFVLPTPGVEGVGPQRIVQGQGGELYYTPDHYKTFIRLN